MRTQMLANVFTLVLVAATGVSAATADSDTEADAVLASGKGWWSLARI